jgi:uncharacterized protein YbaP (TraB family)
MTMTRARGLRAGLCAAVLMAAGAARAEPAIWEVQSPTAKIYLFGTMHILPQKIEWFGPKTAAAFQDSAVLVEEADVGLSNPAALQNIMAQAIAPDEDIWSRLKPEAAMKFRKQLEKCHLPDAVVAHFRPWFAAMLPTMCGLIESAGNENLSVASSSPEAALLAKAKQSGKALDFFETPEQQIGYLSSASDAVQIKELESAIDDGDTGGDDFKGMEAGWAAGDVPAIARLVAQMRSKGAEFYDVIFTQRNARFAAKIAAMLKGSKTVFVAIGAGHLAGPDCVQAQLARMSITSKRL